MMASNYGAPAPRLYRFVFLLSSKTEEVHDGATIEFKTLDRAAAREKADELELLWSCKATLIGRREGMKSDARFIAFVPIDELPHDIRQCERVTLERPLQRPGPGLAKCGVAK